MLDVLLFAEDYAQEKFVGTLILRLAKELALPIKLRVRSSRGGFGRVLRDLERFAQDYAGGRSLSAPDIIVAAVDANCKGFRDRYDRVEAKAGDVLQDRLVVAVADPHIERWFLADGAAFKLVLGHGCPAPDQKCEKDRYKSLLTQAIREAGVEPLLGGIAYAEDLAKVVDLRRAAETDPAFGRFVSALRTKFTERRA